MATKNVLVVDDEPAVRDMVEGLLRHLGHNPYTATNADEALSQLDSCPFDLVLTDLHMPGVKGDQLAEQIKRRKPGLPVVLISGNPSQDYCPQIDRVLRKPFSIQELRETIADLT